MARVKGTTAEQTRAQIIAAALELFSERTFAGTTLRDIAEYLSLTKSAVYYHFDSKDALLAAILAPVADGLRELAERTVEARSRLDPDDRAGSDALKVATVHALVDLQLAHLPLMQSLMFDPSALRALKAHRPEPTVDVEFERAFAGTDDDAVVLQHRCAIGAVNGGILLTVRSMLRSDRPPGSPPAPVAFGPAHHDVLVRSALAVLGLTPDVGGTP